MSAVDGPKRDSADFTQLGGRSKELCYCLLDGFFENPDDPGEGKVRVTIPITKLPATIGRSHDKDEDDPYFFGLGSKKAVSRKHCRISYRDSQGGRVEWDASKQKLVYKEPSGDGKEGHAALNVEDSELPARGFFVIECLGKNRILVDHGRVEQGNAAVLSSGSSLRVSSYTLYFLLPTDSNPEEHVIASAPASSKKRKVPDAAPSSPSTTDNKRSKSHQDELDSLPVEDLLQKMTEAVDSNRWERRHQLIGATIALRAVRDSALDPGMQSIALNGGVSRSDVMHWIEESPKYSNWVQQMRTKLEPRSYQAAITKCLLKAGFTRSGSSGRYIKWYLPKDIPISPHISKKEIKKVKETHPKSDGKEKIEGKKVKDEGGEEDEEEGAETGGDDEDGEEKSEGDGDGAGEEESGGDENEEEEVGDNDDGNSSDGVGKRKDTPTPMDTDAGVDEQDTLPSTGTDKAVDNSDDDGAGNDRKKQ